MFNVIRKPSPFLAKCVLCGAMVVFAATVRESLSADRSPHFRFADEPLQYNQRVQSPAPPTQFASGSVPMPNLQLDYVLATPTLHFTGDGARFMRFEPGDHARALARERRIGTERKAVRVEVQDVGEPQAET
ncbi:MAG TPA: hypothetical protein VN224_11090 [Xanthomonadales bacterium]|nr:hypothetical protein [Xanthomonadales bacterium]